MTAITVSSLAARNKKTFFLVEANNETMKELYKMLLNVRKKYKA